MQWTGEIVSVSQSRRRLQLLFALTYMMVGLLLATAGMLIVMGDSQVALWFLSAFGLPHAAIRIYGGLMAGGAALLLSRVLVAWRQMRVVSPRVVRWTTFPFLVHVVGTVAYSVAEGGIGSWLASMIYFLTFVLLNAFAVINPLVNRLMR